MLIQMTEDGRFINERIRANRHGIIHPSGDRHEKQQNSPLFCTGLPKRKRGQGKPGVYLSAFAGLPLDLNSTLKPVLASTSSMNRAPPVS